MLYKTFLKFFEWKNMVLQKYNALLNTNSTLLFIFQNNFPDILYNQTLNFLHFALKKEEKFGDEISPNLCQKKKPYSMNYLNHIIQLKNLTIILFQKKISQIIPIICVNIF